MRKKLIILCRLLIGIFLFLSCLQSTIYSQDNDSQVKIRESKCLEAEELNFCAAVKSDSNNVVLDTSLKNLSGERIVVPVLSGDFDQIYKVEITDSEGNLLISRRQMILEKIKNKTATDVEKASLLRAYSGPLGFEEELGSQKELKLSYNLDYFYNLEKKGIYHIKITRLFHYANLSDANGKPVKPIPKNIKDNFEISLEEIIFIIR